ncbi:MAG: fused MFS/spermidine synthase [Acidimicrobiia bacterium]|nr:fused MFS/spermidine synthase [Acidimicrobiia bacterium]
MSDGTARFLVFTSAAAILVLEIMAGRLMAPFTGVTLESFTAIIGTVLAGISLGSWAGGRMADTYDPARLIGPAFLLGGILAMLSGPLIQWLGPPLRGGTSLNAVVLAGLAFFVPAMVLSGITPMVIKLRLADLDDTGKVVGRMSAFGTAGAIAGTFITGFLLVAAFPSRFVLLGLGGVLILLGLWSAISSGGSKVLLPGVLVAVASGALTATVSGICQIESAYSCIEVVEASQTGRLLLMDSVRHSFVDIADPTHLEFRYARVFGDVILTQTDGTQDALYIGGGGFTFPQWLKAVRPGSTNTVLELDRALPDIAHERLGLDPGEVDRLELGDARISVAKVPAASIDLVVADAFGGLVTPWHLTTLEFNRDVKRTMRPDAILVMNLIDYPPVDFGRAEVATLQSTFGHVAVIAPPDYFTNRRGGNFVVVASDAEIDTLAIAKELDRRDGDEVVLEALALAEWVGSARLLTDDYAPVDQLISR